MEVNGQLHAAAALPPRERARGTHFVGGWVGPRAGMEAGEEKNSQSWESPPIVHPVA
jgi:hypothetical protein